MILYYFFLNFFLHSHFLSELFRPIPSMFAWDVTTRITSGTTAILTSAIETWLAKRQISWPLFSWLQLLGRWEYLQLCLLYNVVCLGLLFRFLRFMGGHINVRLLHHMVDVMCMMIINKPSKTDSTRSRGLCYYHRTFGEDACRQPCNWPLLGKDQAGR